MTASQLLSWMTYHHLPLQLWREDEGLWVVVDGSSNNVLGSGETAEYAIRTAHEREVQPT